MAKETFEQKIHHMSADELLKLKDELKKEIGERLANNEWSKQACVCSAQQVARKALRVARVLYGEETPEFAKCRQEIIGLIPKYQPSTPEQKAERFVEKIYSEVADIEYAQRSSRIAIRLGYCSQDAGGYFRRGIDKQR